MYSWRINLILRRVVFTYSRQNGSSKLLSTWQVLKEVGNMSEEHITDKIMENYIPTMGMEEREKRLRQVQGTFLHLVGYLGYQTE
jgi:hypothetical protein